MPQGLKPTPFSSVCGTAEAMPCYKARHGEFFRSLFNRRGMSLLPFLERPMALSLAQEKPGNPPGFSLEQTSTFT
jgi:hypothetical protein